MITVMLVDDHELVRVGLERLLEQADDLSVVAVAGSGQEALEFDATIRADVVLMDLSMPRMDGVEATRLLLGARPDAQVVMLTAHTEPDRVMRALDADALGYLAKDSDPEALIAGVRAASAGEAPLDPRAARALLDARRAPRVELTDRELEVLGQLASGMTNKQIARALGISEKTVKTHLTRVYSHIGVGDRVHAAIWARDNRSLWERNRAG